ncbi:MAG: hypothetical protein ACYCWW_09755 [Deltaproteobacteria bacterium]
MATEQHGVHNGKGAIVPQLPIDLGEARQKLEDWNRTALRFVRERPGACLLGALAFGFVVGRIVTRR